MISFDPPKPIVNMQQALKMVAENMMRPVSRYFDEHDQEIPWDYINFVHMGMGATARSFSPAPENGESKNGNGKSGRPSMHYQNLVYMIEMLAWGDVGIYLCTPGGGLGAAAIEATGTPEQKARFLARFRAEKPAFGAMAMTEPQAGSDTSAIRTRAVLDKESNQWVLSGEKIFVTGGKKSLVDTNGLVVVWATLDPNAGRAGMRPFVVEAGTEGIRVEKTEHKMGIRASDTATLVLQDCRIPYENILGSPEVVVRNDNEAGFKGAMKTFDATRPLVSASAIGVARATVELLKDLLTAQGIEIRYGLPRQKLTAIERDVIDMEVMLEAAWLMTIKAAWMADNGKPNPLEASMSKVKAGEIVTKITQKAVEMMGPLGYSQDFLLEKWFRDAKISDIYEGTGQINRLIVARHILGYSGRELR
ncbi:MAG: acyl-CoA dehydrogenase family protein [Anaerolineales bacterium]